MGRLRDENGQLQEINNGLQSENKRLWKMLDEQEAAKAWSSFDIVEEHYRQLERHRQHIEQGELSVSTDADQAAGVPSVTASPRTCKCEPLSPQSTPSWQQACFDHSQVNDEKRASAAPTT